MYSMETKKAGSFLIKSNAWSFGSKNLVSLENQKKAQNLNFHMNLILLLLKTLLSYFHD